MPWYPVPLGWAEPVANALLSWSGAAATRRNPTTMAWGQETRSSARGAARKVPQSSAGC